MSSNIYIIGAGGLGREIAATLSCLEIKSNFDIVGFIDDNQPVDCQVNSIKIIGGIKHLKTLQSGNILIGIGNPKIRESIFNQLNIANTFTFPYILHPGANIHSNQFVSIGQGCYIADGCILTTNISIGKFTYLLPGVSLSHDTIIGHFCTLMPGVRISSGATIGANVTIGTGSIIAKPVSICNNAVIPPGSIITSNIDTP
jgi:sugar O-acyltransferase (sialic acid O-acetyltransferase NeuD family)